MSRRCLLHHITATGRTDGRTLHGHVEQFTRDGATCYSDEWQGYDKSNRRHRTASHGEKEWARDDDSDGIREVHIDAVEGLWQTVRNFLRGFRGVHKKNLKYYVAMYEHRINRKRVSPAFISQLIKAH